MTLALTLTLLLYFGVGFAVKALVATGELPALVRSDDATPIFLLQYTPIFLAAIVFSGVVAAIMSTVNSFMNIGAAAITHDLPVAFGRRMKNELRWGRISTIVISVVAALVAQRSGTVVALLGIFGWGLFASTLVPALAIGLNWPGATRAGAIASILTGLGLTLVLETLAFYKVLSIPAGVTISGLALILSLLMFLLVSWATRRNAESEIDPDIRLAMEV
jgi:Na+/proline symporter